MFTLNDIKPLVRVDGACAVLIHIDEKDVELDFDTCKVIGNQIKKATKLPVIFIRGGMEIEFTTDERYARMADSN